MPCEARTLVGNRHDHPPWSAQKLQLQRPLGPRAGVAHRVRHKLGDEQKDVVADGIRQGAVFLAQALPARRRPLRPLR